MIHYFPPLALAGKLLPAGAFIGGLLSILFQELSAKSISFWQTAVSVLLAGLMSLSALVAKDYLDKRREQRAALSASQQANALVTIDKEKIVDQRVLSLIDEMEKFYVAQHATDRSSIELLRSLAADKETFLVQQRELIASQAEIIHQLQVQKEQV